MKIKKEATVAVIIGLFIALLVTGGVIRARSALKSLKLPTKDSFKKTAPAESQNKELFLEILTPDNSVTSEAKLTLSGKTLPGTFITILGEKGEYLIVPNELGSFSQEITLVKGANTIRVSVFQNDGKKLESTVSAVYTTAEI